jgi:hypothetical protein
LTVENGKRLRALNREMRQVGLKRVIKPFDSIPLA